MARIEVRRLVAADPAGVALLLAEVDGWTGIDHDWVVEPPRRLDDGFAADLQVSEPPGLLAAGALTVTPRAVGSEIRLQLVVPSRFGARDLKRSAGRFLDLLSERAQARSYAA
jgi:hypothetical protein